MAARTCRLHLRFPATFAGTAAYVTKLTTVFTALNTDVDFVEASSTPIVDGRLDDIDTGRCAAGATPGVEALFADFAPQPLGDDDITVFFAGQIDAGGTLGCAAHPSGHRGVIVSCRAAAMVLPHEIAHLFLGDVHNHTNKRNLMWRNSDEIVEPPTLTTAQRDQIRTGAWAAVVAFPAPEDALLSNGVRHLRTLTVNKRLNVRTKEKTTKEKKKREKKRKTTKTKRTTPRRKRATIR